MKITLSLMAAILGLGVASCTTAPNKTNYAAVSVAPVQTAVAGAQDRVSKARVRSTKISEHAVVATAKTKTAIERIVRIEALSKESQSEIHALALQIHIDLDLLTASLLGVTEENQALGADLEETKKSLDTATLQLVQVQKDNDQMAQLLNESNRALNAAILQGKIDKRNAHRFKWIIIGLAVAATGIGIFAVFRGASFAPPLIYATVGAPAAVGTFLFFWLGSG